MSGVRQAALAAGDAVAWLAFLVFVAGTFYRPLFAGIISQRLPEFSNLVPWALGGIGMYWLLRRHLVRILIFQALVTSSARDETSLRQRTRWLFDTLDIISWVSVTVVIASVAWLVAGSNPPAFSNRLPIQGLLIELFSFPALLGAGWLVLRSSWYPKIVPQPYRRVIALGEAINCGNVVPLDLFIHALSVPSVGEETAKLLAREYGDADTWLEQMQQAAEERRRHSTRTTKEKAGEDVGPAYARLCNVGSMDVATANAMCSLWDNDGYIDVVRNLRARLTIQSIERLDGSSSGV